MGAQSSSPFRTRTVLLLIAAGLVLTLGFLLVSGYGDRIDRQRSNVPSPTSRFATGFHGLSTLIKKSGGTVTLADYALAEPGRGLMIFTPNPRTRGADLEAALSEAADENAPALIVLPKWGTRPQKLRPTRE